MKKVILIFGLLLTILTGCSSSDDKPLDINKKSWKIGFTEEFRETHNNSEQFKEWYSINIDYLQSSRFLVHNQSYEWVYPPKQNTYDYYEISYCGILQWIVELHNVDENIIKSMVEEFESFTLEEDEEKRYDKFTAEYCLIEDNAIASNSFP